MSLDARELQMLVAQELARLGLPIQAFEIQASYLSFSQDLGIQIDWPVTMNHQGAPTGVIQIGAKKANWNPQTRCVIVYARLLSRAKLLEEIHRWCVTMTAIARMELERKGGEWPNGWPRYKVLKDGGVIDLAVRTEGITTTSVIN